MVYLRFYTEESQQYQVKFLLPPTSSTIRVAYVLFSVEAIVAWRNVRKEWAAASQMYTFRFEVNFLCLAISYEGKKSYKQYTNTKI